MKRFIAFTGICTLAFCVTQKAVGATNYGYGSYDASCPANDTITVKVYGYNVSNRGFGVVSTQWYDVSTGNIKTTNINYSGFQTYLKNTVTVSGGTYNGISIKNGLIPRGLVFYSLGTTNLPTESVFKNKDYNYITTNTACGISRFYKDFTGDMKTLAQALSFPVYGSNTFPSLTKTVNGTTAKKLIIDTYNETQINYIIAYAANCQDNTNATCELTIGNSGSAIYSNSCDSGSFMNSDTGFGLTAGVCVDSAAIAPEPLAAPSSTAPAS